MGITTPMALMRGMNAASKLDFRPPGTIRSDMWGIDKMRLQEYIEKRRKHLRKLRGSGFILDHRCEIRLEELDLLATVFRDEEEPSPVAAPERLICPTYKAALMRHYGAQVVDSSRSVIVCDGPACQKWSHCSTTAQFVKAAAK